MAAMWKHDWRREDRMAEELVEGIALWQLFLSSGARQSFHGTAASRPTADYVGLLFCGQLSHRKEDHAYDIQTIKFM